MENTTTYEIRAVATSESYSYGKFATEAEAEAKRTEIEPLVREMYGHSICYVRKYDPNRVDPDRTDRYQPKSKNQAD